MELPLSIVPDESNVSLVSEEEVEKRPDPFQSPLPVWSTRFYCLQAYCCFILSYFNTLKFCKSVGKYGFIVFFPYWMFSTFFGAGAVLVEMFFGRYVIGNVARAWEMCPLSRGILWCLFGTTFITLVYDHLSNVYLLKYFFASFGESLPWETCDPEWAGDNCYELDNKPSAFARCMTKFSEQYCRNLNWESAAMQYWNTQIQGTEYVGDVAWTILCLALSVTLALLMNYKGIRSVEKLFPIFVYPTVALWFMNACVCLIIPTSLKGLKELCEIKWEYLFILEFWIDGFRDVVYFLGLSKLTLSFISSHGRFDDNILLDVIIASFGGLFFSALITVPILSIIAGVKGSNMDEGGIFMQFGQVFVYMSEAITYYPYPKSLWSVLSYLNWFVLSSSAQVLSVLAICEAIEGVVKYEKNIFFWVLSLVSFTSFCVGMVVVFFPSLHHLKVGKCLLSVFVLHTLTWQHAYGIRRLNKDYYFMMGRPLPLFLKASWISVAVIPFIMIAVNFLHTWHLETVTINSYIYYGIPCGIFVLSMFSKMFKFYRLGRSVMEVFQPNPDWGPQNPILRKSRAALDSTTAPREILYRQELCNRAFTKPPDISTQNIVHLT